MSDMEQHFIRQVPEQPNINGHVTQPTEVISTGKMFTQPVSLDEIDLLLSLLPEEDTGGETATVATAKDPSVVAETVNVPDETDLLLNDLDQAIQGMTREIKGWGIERKRLEARQTVDSFVLGILATDEDLVVRTLACFNPNMPPEQLLQIGRGNNRWFQMVAAYNPSTPTEVLNELADCQEPDIRRGVEKNPSTSPVTLHKLNANQT